MRNPFRLTAVVILIILAFSLTACSSLPEQAAHPPGTQPAPQSLDLNQIKDERLRLEQQLADYEKHLEQIWQKVAESS